MLAPRKANIIRREVTINPFEINPTTGLGDELASWGRANAEAKAQPINLNAFVATPQKFPRQSVIIPEPQQVNYNYGLNNPNGTDGTDLYYKDSAFDWAKSPTASTVSPMLKADINRPTYSDATLAANNIVLVNGRPQSVAWIKPKGAGNYIPHTMINGDSVPLEGEQKDLFTWYGNKPDNISVGKDQFFNRAVRVYPADATNLPNRNQMQNLNQEMSEINQLMAAGSSGNVADPFAPAVVSERINESPDVGGYDEIQALARRGGSGRWSNQPIELGVDVDPTTFPTQGETMQSIDLARGGTRISGGGITSALPAVTEYNYIGDRIKYDKRGFPVDNDVRVRETYGPNLQPYSYPYFEDTTIKRFIEPNNSFIPQGVKALTPASEFYSNTPQRIAYPETANRQIVKFDTTPEVPLRPVTTNEYGVVTAANIAPGRIARSVQLRNGTVPIDNNQTVFAVDYNNPFLDRKGNKHYTGEEVNNPLYGKPEMSSAGRWMGGSLTNAEIAKPGLPRSGYISDRDGLDSGYQIRGNYRPMVDATDPRVSNAIAQDAAARKAAAQMQETFTPPFTRQYSINQTGRTIQPDIQENLIDGAYLPVTRNDVAGEKYDYTPYVPSQIAAQEQVASYSDLLDKDTLGQLQTLEYLRNSNNPYEKLVVKTAENQLGRKANLTPQQDESGLTRLDQQLADVRVRIDGRDYPLTPEATTTPYLPSQKQISAQAQTRHGKTVIDSDGNWWDMDGPTDEELLDIQKQGALKFRAGDDIASVRAKGVGLSDTAEIYANPNIAPTDILGAIAETEGKLNRTKAAITNYRTSPTAQQKVDPLFNSVDLTFNRFMDADESARIAAESQARFANRPDDMSHVSVRDLADIFGDTQPRTLQELEGHASYLQSEVDRAKSAYNQLMGLEAAPEIEIIANAGNRKSETLAEQARQLGMKAAAADGGVTIRGSIPYGSDLNLPVKRNVVSEVDPEIAEMYRLGRLDRMERRKGERIIYPDGQTPIVVPPQQRNVQDLYNIKVVDKPDTTLTLPDGTVKVIPGGRQLVDTRPVPGVGVNYNIHSSPEYIITNKKEGETLTHYLPDQTQAYIPGEQIELTPEQQEKANIAIKKIAPWSRQQQPMLVQDSTDPYYQGKVAEVINQPAPEQTYFMQVDQSVDPRQGALSGMRRRERINAIKDRGLRYYQSPGEGSLQQLRDNGRKPNLESQFANMAQQLDMPIDDATYNYVTRPIVQTNIAAPVVVEPMQEPNYITLADLNQARPQTYQDVMIDNLRRSQKSDPMVYISRPAAQAVTPNEIIPGRQRRTKYQEYVNNPVINVPYTQVIDQPSRQLPSWAIPAAAGGVWLGAAGINEYQRQQEQQRQQEEAQLRMLYR